MKIRCTYKKMLSVEELKKKFHPKNPNTHSDEQIQRLAEIFEYQGIRNPVKLSNLSGRITAGHGRVLAAQKLGMKEFPVDYQEYESEEQEYADLVADNAIAQWSSLEFGKINIEMENLGPDFNIDMLGVNNFVIEPADKINEKEFDENVETDNECPACHYRW